MEQTVVLIKPDAVAKKLIGRIITHYEEHGLQIVDAYISYPTRELLDQHYAEHLDKSFYANLMEFMQSGPVMALLLDGENAIEVVRDIHGATNPANARPCTIRYLFGTNATKNAVHGSATREEAEREIALWFPNNTSN